MCAQRHKNLPSVCVSDRDQQRKVFYWDIVQGSRDIDLDIA